jgi:hypothetical protein
MGTKAYSIYRIDDKRCPDGKMKKADGPAIKEALKKGLIKENDIWDCDESKLLEKLKIKHVIE